MSFNFFCHLNGAYECMVYYWKAHATQNLISTKPHKKPYQKHQNRHEKLCKNLVFSTLLGFSKAAKQA